VNLGYARRRIAIEVSKRYRWLECTVHPATALVLAISVPVDLPSAGVWAVAEWAPVVSVVVACGRLYFPVFKMQRVEHGHDTPDPPDPNTIYWWPER